jgi:hypothetical protein
MLITYCKLLYSGENFIIWENLCPNPIWYIYQIKYVQAKKNQMNVVPNEILLFMLVVYIFIIFLFWTLINVRDHKPYVYKFLHNENLLFQRKCWNNKKNVRFLTQALVAWKYPLSLFSCLIFTEILKYARIHIHTNLW